MLMKRILIILLISQLMLFVLSSLTPSISSDALYDLNPLSVFGFLLNLRKESTPVVSGPTSVGVY